MATYTTEERIFLVLEYYRCDKDADTTRRSFQRQFGVKKGPDRHTIRSLFEKFEKTGSVHDDRAGKAGRPKTSTTPENVEKVKSIIEKSPTKSIRRTAQQASLSATSTYRIITRELQLFPYKVQTHQPISIQAQSQREDFANIISDMIDRWEIEADDIWFSDEAHFHLDGYVNKQNWRIWGSENPHIAVQRSLHPIRTTVWAALSSHGIVGPIFINETVNSERYIEILKQFINNLSTL